MLLFCSCSQHLLQLTQDPKSFECALVSTLETYDDPESGNYINYITYIWYVYYTY
jgi:hypothetical protein